MMAGYTVNALRADTSGYTVVDFSKSYTVACRRGKTASKRLHTLVYVEDVSTGIRTECDQAIAISPDGRDRSVCAPRERLARNLQEGRV
jgi:hypothetical protein